MSRLTLFTDSAFLSPFAEHVNNLNDVANGNGRLRDFSCEFEVQRFKGLGVQNVGFEGLGVPKITIRHGFRGLKTKNQGFRGLAGEVPIFKSLSLAKFSISDEILKLDQNWYQLALSRLRLNR